MKQQELKQIISKLQTDPMYAISVTNVDMSGAEFRLITNANNEKLTSNYGGAKEFFENLFAKGMHKIKVYPRKRNGTHGDKINYKSVGEGIEFQFSSSGNASQVKPVTEAPSLPAVPIVPALSAPVLSSHGLSGAEIYRVHDYDRLLRENAEMKAKNDLLQKENEELKKENLTNELLGQRSVDKAKHNAEMLNSPVVAMLAQLVAGKIMPGADSVPGLSQPALSPLKQQFCSLDESYLTDLVPVVKGMSEIQGFDEELTELLKKHNLI